ncbi:MAG: hypothetical protein QF907_05905 [Nitrospinota bacterium]|nr:hypothetical protein [Nitrospinota bacterium]MDP7581521.1 hypothetical protein [Nitrospinota bacterium]HJN02855.1 hypothetical protein [Nitrospinota bacterium]
MNKEFLSNILRFFYTSGNKWEKYRLAQQAYQQSIAKKPLTICSEPWKGH